LSLRMVVEAMPSSLRSSWATMSRCNCNGIPIVIGTWRSELPRHVSQRLDQRYLVHNGTQFVQPLVRTNSFLSCASCRNQHPCRGFR
jgi:hypothetical protein